MRPTAHIKRIAEKIRMHGRGMDPQLADASFELGINVVHDSTMRYLEATRKSRKGEK